MTSSPPCSSAKGSTIRVVCAARACPFAAKSRAVARYGVDVNVSSFVRDLVLRPRDWLEVQVIKQNQDAGIEPAIWKIEGLETADAARAVVTQIRSGGRSAISGCR